MTQTYIGYVGQDVDLKTVSSGKSVANTSIGISRGRKDNKSTMWIRVTAWDTLAENMTRDISKGDRVIVVGEFNFDKDTGSPRVYEKSNSSGHGASFEFTAYEFGKLVRSYDPDASLGNNEAKSVKPMITEDEIPF